MPKVAVIGTTTWGTTLGIVLARKGIWVRLWARTQEEAKELSQAQQNSLFLPGISFPRRLSVTASVEKAFEGVALVLLGVPAQSLRSNVRLIKKHLDKSMLIVSAAKGLEEGSTRMMTEVLAEELPPALHPNICVLSGPNLAKEVVQGLPAASVVAARDIATAERAQKLLAAPNFCVFTSTDILGVELGGALKNIVALGAGIADGLGYGDNAKAAFMTRGLAEIAALGVAAGANPLTFAGLAGVGDLIVTCASPLSRNHYVGVELGKGRSLKEITSSMREVAEGIATTAAACQLAKKLGVEMPIAQQLYRVLFEGLDPRRAAAELMGRPVRHELAGIQD